MGQLHLVRMFLYHSSLMLLSRQLHWFTRFLRPSDYMMKLIGCFPQMLRI